MTGVFKMKKIIAFLLIAVLAISLVACNEEDPAAKFYGTWESEIDAASYLESYISEEKENRVLRNHLELSPLSVKVTLTIKEDGTLHRVMGDLSKEEIEVLKQDLIKGFNAYYADYAKRAGLTLKELLEQTKISPEWKAEQIANETYLKNALMEMNFLGDWKLEEERLYMGTHEEVVAKKNLQTYTLEEGVLTLESASFPSEFEADYYPLTFTKK